MSLAERARRVISVSQRGGESAKWFVALYIGQASQAPIISSIMSSAVPNPYSLLRQTLDHMSPFDTGLLVLFTSFVCHFAAFPTLDSDRCPDFLSVFPPLRT